jgi:RNA polymerase sigma factor (sigma-70 family)
MERRDKRSLVSGFQDLYGDLLRLLTWRTGNPDSAADLVHETYLRLASLPEGSAIANPRSYIMRTASNVAIDRLRWERRRQEKPLDDPEAEAVADRHPSPERALAARQRLELLDQALRELPPKVRQALLLSRVDGLTQAEIARRLGVSESMVVKYIAKALRHCQAWRQRLDESE